MGETYGIIEKKAREEVDERRGNREVGEERRVKV